MPAVVTTQATSYNRAFVNTAQTSFTFCMWFKHNSLGTYRTPFSIESSSAGVMFQSFGGDTSRMGIYDDVPGSQVLANGLTVEPDLWYFVALAWSGTSTTNAQLYTRTSAASALTASALFRVQQRNTSILRIGSNRHSEPIQGAVYAVKCWASRLTAAEILAESQYALPQVAAPLGAWRLADHTDVADRSGNARPLAAGATATDATFTLPDGPASGPEPGRFLLAA